MDIQGSCRSRQLPEIILEQAKTNKGLEFACPSIILFFSWREAETSVMYV